MTCNFRGLRWILNLLIVGKGNGKCVKFCSVFGVWYRYILMPKNCVVRISNIKLNTYSKTKLTILVVIQNATYNRCSPPVVSHDITRPTRKSNSENLVPLARTSSYVTLICTKLTVMSTYIPDLRASCLTNRSVKTETTVRWETTIKQYRPTNHIAEFCDFTDSTLRTAESNVCK
jgi:hypothetical protein